MNERAAAGKRQPTDDEQPGDDPPRTNAGTRIVRRRSPLGLPSAFIATADQWPFLTGQVMVCAPVPVARARQMFRVAGSAASAPAPSRW